MKYVYILRSLSNPQQRYVGITENLKLRLKDRNAGNCTHTRKFIPWRYDVAEWFTDDKKAQAFERYLKHGSGHAFARRHF